MTHLPLVMRIVSASDYSSALHKLPTFDELAELENDELHFLARCIAKIHKHKIAQLAPAALASYVTAEHQYGVRHHIRKTMTIDGISERLQTVDFWRKQIYKKADASRERQQVLLGDVGQHGQEYCSDLTIRILEEREELSNKKFEQYQKKHGVTPTSHTDIAKARNNKKYLLALALLEIAKLKGFKCFMLTITCPAIFHSPGAYSKVSNAEGVYDDAYRFLAAFWKALSDTLRSNFTTHTDYFGLRATEVHENGCPHYHIIFFCAPAVEPLLRKKLAKLFNEDPLRPTDHFENHSHEIIKALDQEEHPERRPLSYTLKLLFDDNQSSPETQQERNEKRRRSNHALKASGKHAVEFFGVEGIQLKMDTVKKAARNGTGREAIRELGRKLIVDRNVPQHNQARLAAIVNFIKNDAPRLELTWADRENKYGEVTKKVSGIRLCAARRIPELPSIAELFRNTSIRMAYRVLKSNLPARHGCFIGGSYSINPRVTHNTSRYRRKFTSVVKLHYPSAFALIYFWFSSRSRDSPATHRPSRAPPALAKLGCCRKARSLATKPRETGRSIVECHFDVVERHPAPRQRNLVSYTTVMASL